MKLRSGRHIVRRKNIYLPTEVWVDVFCFPWIIRKKMAQMVDEIGNRWFGEQLQFYLHEWGKHTLGDLYFKPQGICKWQNRKLQLLEYPQTVMPGNIKFCETLEIKHFDNRVFNFFRRIQSLLTANTKLDIRYIHEGQMNNVRTILGHLLPFMDGIHTMQTDDWMLPIVNSFPPDKFHKVKMLDVHLHGLAQSAMPPIMEWLTSGNNEPKLLQLRYYKNEIAQPVLESIRKQFMEATKTSTFAVVFSNNSDFPAFNCENAIGEQLCGVLNKNTHGKFKVFRHQANSEAGDQLRQWVDGNTDKNGIYNDGTQYIRLLKANIGNGRIFALPDLDEADNEEKEEDEEKPSTSKKRRISK